jgi:hypothetical protein
MIVKISHGDNQGTIEYTGPDKPPRIMFPDPLIAKKIQKHLTTERRFKIPESGRIDDYRIDRVKPTDNETYFRLALGTLHTKTGVWVIW